MALQTAKEAHKRGKYWVNAGCSECLLLFRVSPTFSCFRILPNLSTKNAFSEGNNFFGSHLDLHNFTYIFHISAINVQCCSQA